MSVTGILLVFVFAWLGLHLFANGINREAREAAERAKPFLALAQGEPPHVIERQLVELHPSAALKQTLSTLAIRAVISIGANGQPIVADRRRHDEAHDPEHQALVPTLAQRLEAATELLAGLQEARSNFGNVVLQVSINPNVFEHEMQLMFGVVSFVVPIVVALSILLARRLTRAALEPLEHVTDSLRRLGSGDLTLRSLKERGDIEFRDLAEAYNSAVTRVAMAMHEQERNQEQMRHFIADAGHQLKTPLTVIRGFVAVLLKADRGSSMQSRRILNTIAQHSLVMGSLIEKMIILDAWERDVIVSEPCEIRDTIRRVVEPFQIAWPERIIKVDGPEVFVEIDTVECTHILTNVIENSLKYTTGPVDIAIVECEHAVDVVVADCGPGMNAEACSHAFDRFYRGEHREVPGSGLGLAIAYRAVERARGSIALSSAPTTGTTITVTLSKSYPIEDEILVARG
jgi:signal transduction histidine kinase